MLAVILADSLMLSLAATNCCSSGVVSLSLMNACTSAAVVRLVKAPPLVELPIMRQQLKQNLRIQEGGEAAQLFTSVSHGPTTFAGQLALNPP